MLGRDFAVVCASGAREALGLLSDGLDVDVALCDLAMPGMGGIEFYREVCRRFPELHSSVIFLSGGCGDGDSKVSVESVGGRYISKPWCPQQLHSSIVEAIAQKRVSVSRDTCGYDSEHDEGDEPPQSAAG